PKFPWWKFWVSRKPYWKVVSGTRNIEYTNSHLPGVRKAIEAKLAPNLYKGEQVYYEIVGFSEDGKAIQEKYPYGCAVGEFRVCIYRVTMTSAETGVCEDLSRAKVYARAEELGFEFPELLTACSNVKSTSILQDSVERYCQGKSHWDEKTLLEGVVIWFINSSGKWCALKHKSMEFLLEQDRHQNKTGKSDIEDTL
ncbi:MAG: hypothetical protein ACTSPB_20715, partial [Candidatus Thorarchaeota archaeon]